MTLTSREIKAKVKAAEAQYLKVLGRQMEQRAAAERQLRQARTVLDTCDEALAPFTKEVERLRNELHERQGRTLGPWATDKGRDRWFSGHRYLHGREQEWYTSAAWLRVGLWLPAPHWFLDIRTYGVCRDTVRGGQFNLGRPNEDDPDDGAKVRARADELLIEAGYLLIEREEPELGARESKVLSVAHELERWTQDDWQAFRRGYGASTKLPVVEWAGLFVEADIEVTEGAHTLGKETLGMHLRAMLGGAK